MKEEKIVFRNEDGTDLVGILATPENATKKCIILCHGISVNKDEDGIFVELSEKLVDKGYAVFRFDFRGHGESGGRSIDMTITGEQDDIESAVTCMGKRGFTSFGLLGVSFAGGPASLYTAAHPEKIKVLVLWNALIDYATTLVPNTTWGKASWGQPAIDRVNRLGYTEIGTGMFRVGKKLLEEMGTLEPWKALVDLDTPVLFVHGNKDTYIDYHESMKYSLLIKNAELEIIKGAEHGFHDNDEHANQAIIRTVDFFQKHLYFKESTHTSY